MTTLQWDQVGERTFETGVDRGVLYLPNVPGVAWNGLSSFSEKSSGNEPNGLYFDGVKYADTTNSQEFAGTLKAFTYPDEFLECEGIYEDVDGFFVTGQQPSRFGLSYRTLTGDDEDGVSGYKIHILYNLLAIPAGKAYQSASPSFEPVVFEWSLTAIPEAIAGFRPTAHFILDSRTMSPELLQDLENSLYGDGISEPNLPSASTLVSFISDWVLIRITDHGDGTWTAEGGDNLVYLTDATSFAINQANARYLDGDTYVISDLTY